jgi:uncharacterized iron-regulated membrane protein
VLENKIKFQGKRIYFFKGFYAARLPCTKFSGVTTMSTIDPLSPVAEPIRVTGKQTLAALKKITLRKVLLKIHLYISLWLGVFLVMAGLTGSLLVYDHAIDKWLNSDTMQVEVGQQRLPLSMLIAAANQVSSIKASPVNMQLPEDADDVLMVRYEVPMEHKGHDGKEHKMMHAPLREVMVNPYTGQVLGDRVRNDSLMSIVVRLHANLLIGDTGKLVMGITALLTLVLTITGIYLWWPKFSKIKQAFTIKKNASFTRFNIDLHKTAGIYTAVILMVIAFSGVYFNLPQIFKPAVNFFSPLDGMTGMAAMMEMNEKTKSAPSNGATPLSPEAVVLAVEAAYPDIEIQRLVLAKKADDSIRVTGRQVGEIRSKGATNIWVDQYSGQFLQVRDPFKFNAGTAFVNLQLPLHNGEILGTTGRILVLITGFAPLLLMVTGIIQWLKKRKAKHIHDARLRSI